LSIINAEIEWYDGNFVVPCRPRKKTITFQKGPERGGSIPPISFDMNLFDEPAKSFTYVMLGFNKEQHVMAIKPIEFKVRGSYKICVTKEGQREKITAGRFLNKHGLWHVETTDYEPEFDEDRQILLVAIDKDKLVKNG